MERWSEYYKEHPEYQSGNLEGNEGTLIHFQNVQEFIEPPSSVDLELAINKLKNGKASGFDHLQAEFIKKGSKELKELLLIMIV